MLKKKERERENEGNYCEMCRSFNEPIYERELLYVAPRYLCQGNMKLISKLTFFYSSTAALLCSSRFAMEFSFVAIQMLKN